MQQKRVLLVLTREPIPIKPALVHEVSSEVIRQLNGQVVPLDLPVHVPLPRRLLRVPLRPIQRPLPPLHGGDEGFVVAIQVDAENLEMFVEGCVVAE